MNNHSFLRSSSPPTMHRPSQPPRMTEFPAIPSTIFNQPQPGEATSGGGVGSRRTPTAGLPCFVAPAGVTRPRAVDRLKLWRHLYILRAPPSTLSLQPLAAGPGRPRRQCRGSSKIPRCKGSLMSSSPSPHRFRPSAASPPPPRPSSGTPPSSSTLWRQCWRPTTA